MAVSKTSWKPGQSGNPNGSPKRENRLSAIIDRLVEKKHSDFKLLLEKVESGDKAIKNMRVKEVMAIKYVDKILKGSDKFIMDHRNRTEGMPTQPHKIDANVNITDTLDELDDDKTDYEQFGREAKKQALANEPSIQNQEQSGGVGHVQNEPDANETRNGEDGASLQSYP